MRPSQFVLALSLGSDASRTCELDLVAVLARECWRDTDSALPGTGGGDWRKLRTPGVRAEAAVGADEQLAHYSGLRYHSSRSL